MTEHARSAAWDRRKLAVRRWRPARVRLLLVAEAPESDDRHFYFERAAESDALFPEVAEVLFEARPDAAADRTPWLKELKRRGVFLVELKPSAPVKPNESLAGYVPWLSLAIEELSPEHLVIVGPAVHAVAAKALRAAGLPLVDARIPSPAAGREVEFRQAFRAAIVRAELEKLIRPLPAPRAPRKATPEGEPKPPQPRRRATQARHE